MGLSLLVVADSTSVVQFGTNDQQAKCLAGVFNQDRHDCVVLNSINPPTLAQLHASGAWLGPFGEPQAQLQELIDGVQPSQIWLGCTPFMRLIPGMQVDVSEDAYPVKPNGITHGYVGANFIVPPVGDTVAVELVSACGSDANSFAGFIGDYVDRETNRGIAIAGGIWDLLSVDDATHITIRNRGLPCAAVTAYG